MIRTRTVDIAKKSTGVFLLVLLTASFVTFTARGQVQLASAPPPALPVTPPPPGETVRTVRKEIQQKVDKLQSLVCELETTQKREGKKRPKVKTGPMEISRNVGARLKLTRKESTEEYIANRSILWVYDHKDKEAQYIPTNMPVIDTFVNHAMNLNVFMSVDEETLQLVGTQSFEGEECWVLQGLSPNRLSMVGVEQTKIRVWIAKKDGLPRKIGIPSEDITVVLRKLVTNSSIPADHFAFSPPKGVKTKNVFGF